MASTNTTWDSIKAESDTTMDTGSSDKSPKEALDTNHQWVTTKATVDHITMTKGTKATLITRAVPLGTKTKEVAATEDEMLITITTSIRTNTPPNNMVDTAGNRMEWVTIRMAQVEWVIPMACNTKEVWEAAAAFKKTTTRAEREAAAATTPFNKALPSWAVNNPLVYNNNNKAESTLHPPVEEVAGRIKAVAGAVAAKVDGKEINKFVCSNYPRPSECSKILKRIRSPFQPLVLIHASKPIIIWSLYNEIDRH
jgi:hypothetical protein